MLCLFSNVCFPFTMAKPIHSISPETTTSGNTASRHRLTTRRRFRLRKKEQSADLIPGLPDHVAQLCLSHVSPPLLYSVCLSWRRLIYSPSFPPFLSLYAVLSSTSYTDYYHSRNYSCVNNSIEFFNFDPISSRWELLPPPPPDPPLRLIFRHPSFISRHLPIQFVTVSGQLVLLAATTDNLSPAISRPLIFNPISRKWSFGPPLAAPRRWCAAGTVNTAIYVASGIGSQFTKDTAKLVEKWEFFIDEKRNPTTSNYSFLWKWEKVKGLENGRFSRDAVDAIGWRGKLYMVNMKGDHAAKEGLVYDAKKDEWEDMPRGMLAGWRGPVVAMDEEEMYVIDEVDGALRKYDSVRDEWEYIMESENFKGTRQIAGGGGRVCVVCGGDNNGIAVVDVLAQPARLWMVETPPGFEAVAVHILPRMSKPEL